MKTIKQKLLLSLTTTLSLFLLLTWSCKKEDPVVLAEINTIAITEITPTTAKSGANITSDGGSEIIARGLVWDINPGPTTEQHTGMTTEGTGPGMFASNLTSLSPKTTYYVRAYAINNLGISYGEEKSFETPNNDGNPCIGMPTVTDARDNNTYQTVQIGEQCWLKENLKYLPVVYPTAGITSLSARYYVYGYEGTNVFEAKNTDNYKNYGVLYNHAAALNACPAGWHLPGISEWRQMRDYLINEYDLEAGNYENNLGTRLKSRRQVDSPLGGEFATTVHPRWDYHATLYGTDDFGFSALPGGGNGVYTSGIGLRLILWSSTPSYTDSAWSMWLKSDSVAFVESDIYTVKNGFSIRCVKD